MRGYWENSGGGSAAPSSKARAAYGPFGEATLMEGFQLILGENGRNIYWDEYTSGPYLVKRLKHTVEGISKPVYVDDNNPKVGGNVPFRFTLLAVENVINLNGVPDPASFNVPPPSPITETLSSIPGLPSNILVFLEDAGNAGTLPVTCKQNSKYVGIPGSGGGGGGGHISGIWECDGIITCSSTGTVYPDSSNPISFFYKTNSSTYKKGRWNYRYSQTPYIMTCYTLNVCKSGDIIAAGAGYCYAQNAIRFYNNSMAFKDPKRPIPENDMIHLPVNGGAFMSCFWEVI